MRTGARDREPTEVLTPESSATASAAVDASGMLAADVYCRKCGYNLRGLRPESHCPECGGSIAESLRENLLRFAEPTYVRRLAQGNHWVLQGLTLMVVGYLGSILAAGVFVSSVALAQPPPIIIGYLLMILVWLGGVVIALLGVWRLTSAEPGVYETAARATARRLVRTYLVIGLMGLAFNPVVGRLMPPVMLMAVIMLVSIGLSAFGVVGVVAYLRNLRDLARRIPEPALAGRAAGLARGLGVALGVLVFFEAIDVIARWGPVLLGGSSGPVVPSTMPSRGVGGLGAAHTRWYLVRDCVSMVAWLAVLICFFSAVRLHMRLREPLDEQAKFAAQNRQLAKIGANS